MLYFAQNNYLETIIYCLKAKKIKKTKGEDKEISKLLEFRKRQAYA